MKYLLLMLLCFTMFSCDKGAKTPEGLIKMYINDLTHRKVDKEYFEKYTTGKLWNSVADLNEEDFEKFIDLSKIKNASIKISNKNCVASSCTLTYIVKYDVKSNKKTEFKSEVKKIAVLLKEGDFWKISEVSNVKTYLEAQTSIQVNP